MFKNYTIFSLLITLFIAPNLYGKPALPLKEKSMLAATIAHFSYKNPHKTTKDGHKIYMDKDTKKEYKVVNEFTSDSGKYRAIALMDKDNNLFYSYRGTKGKGDVRTDAIIALNMPLSYLSQKTGKKLTISNSLKKNTERSVNFYNDTLKKLDDAKIKHKSVLVTGHSLGGMMAQIVGHKTGAETHTFNAPGALIKGYFDKPGYTNNIINHVRSTDLIGNYGAHIGQVAHYNQSAKDGSFLKYPLNQHSVTYFKNDIKRGMTPKMYKHGKR
ncbi:MAG: hypothetical protein Q8S31_07485 [Alphaproteobacteria bacterium]|nr:hypothetical protein [Alphaproteobacteria bacterium]